MTEVRRRPVVARSVIAFVPPDGAAFDEPVGRFLADAKAAEAFVVAVATDERFPAPPAPLSGVLSFRSFDFLDAERSRASSLIAGDELARRVVANVWPTCARDRLQMFLSYFAADGLTAAQALHAELQGFRELPVRDALDFRVGHAIRSEIQRKLAECDVLVFIDTPNAGDSDWIRWELAIAMSLAIPIVWVRVGRGQRAELAVWPAHAPDVEVDHLEDVTAPGGARELAARVRERAFEVTLAHVRRACTTVDRIRALPDIDVEEVGPARQIYCVNRRRRFQDRLIPDGRDVIQVFGRRPTPTDRADLRDWLRSAAAGPSAVSATPAAFMLSSSPGAADDAGGGGDVISTDGITYVEELARASERSPREDRPELLLLGAYPRGTGSAQEAREAVHEISMTWLARGGRVRFGGHPTITPLVNLAAELAAPGRTRERVTVYQSRFFVTRATIEEVDELATAVEVDARGDRHQSLTQMREQMVSDGAITAVVVIGGRTDEGGTHRPGVEEEVELAIARHLPVYLVGRPGGHTRALIARHRSESPPWARLGNAMSPIENDELLRTDDYWNVARTIWDRHVAV